MIKVAIVILNWNGFADTRDLLSDLKKINHNGLDISVIVVDNGSKDGSAKALLKLPAFAKASAGKQKFILIENKKNLGYAGGNNVGVKQALKDGNKYIVVMNNDINVDKEIIVELVKVAEKYPKVGAVSPKIYFAKGYEYHKERYSKADLGKVIWYAGGEIDWNNVYGLNRGVNEVDIGQYSSAQKTKYATGTCILLSKEVLEKVGLFDGKYFLYYEDTDLSVRIAKSGYSVMFAPEAVIWHKVSQSSAIGSDLNDYFIHRNRMLFGLKFASFRAKFALFRESIKFMLAGRNWQRKGVIDFYLGRFGRGSWNK